MLSDREIISRYQIKSTDKVLDIGGSMKQRREIKVDTLVDIIRPEKAPYSASRLSAKNFVRLDVTREQLPFKDREFDFCLCSHTLEDLTYPFLVIEEMSRVAKRGLIITPSMGADMVFSHIDITDWLTGARRLPGGAHHKWFFIKEDKKLRVIPKNYPILYTRDFQVIRWRGEEETVFYWERKIDYKEIKDINIHKLIDVYDKYIRSNRLQILKGTALIYFDNPLFILKAYLKKTLKIGAGYLHRETLK